MHAVMQLAKEACSRLNKSTNVIRRKDHCLLLHSSETSPLLLPGPFSKRFNIIITVDNTEMLLIDPTIGEGSCSTAH